VISKDYKIVRGEEGDGIMNELTDRAEALSTVPYQVCGFFHATISSVLRRVS